MPELISIVAELPAIDFPATKTFCRDVLGGELLAEYPDFLIYKINGIELHYWLCDNKNLPEASSIYLRVRDIDGFYEKYKNSGHVVLSLETRPWGIKEFYLQDANGILYKFGEDIS